MSLKIMLLGLLFTSIATAACQTLFKKVLTSAGTTPALSSEYVPYFFKLLLNPYFLLALFLYGLALLLWLYLLSGAQLSVIYPIGIALNVITTLLATRYFLGEALSLVQIAGVFVIFAGIFLVSY